MLELNNIGRVGINEAREEEDFIVFPQKEELNALGYEYGPQRQKNQENQPDNEHQAGPDNKYITDVAGVAFEAHVADWAGYDPFDITYVFPTTPNPADGDIGGIIECKRITYLARALTYRHTENHHHIIIAGMVEHDGERLSGNIVLTGWNYPVFDHKFAKFDGYDNSGRRMDAIPVHRRRPMHTLIPVLQGGVAA